MFAMLHESSGSEAGRGMARSHVIEREKESEAGGRREGRREKRGGMLYNERNEEFHSGRRRKEG